MTMVACSACGDKIMVYHDFDRDTQTLSRHARVHVEQDESFKVEFNDSPIKFPIEYVEVEENYGW